MTDPAIPLEDRYSRQKFFVGIGPSGQEKLLASRVLIIGCGALGSATTNFLARAGVGYLRVCDRDFVELNNLQRQILFDENHVANNMPKAEAAAERIRQINSGIEVDPRVVDVNFTNVEQLTEGIDLIMDGTDNFATRYVINDIAVKKGLPWVYGGCVGSYGVVMPVIPGETACIRCAFPDPPPPGISPTCDTAGVLNGIASIVAARQSTEACKILMGKTDTLQRGLVNIDIWTNDFHHFKIERSEDCPTCGKGDYEFLNATGGMKLTSLCGRNAIQIVNPAGGDVDFEEMAEKIRPLAEVRYNKFLMKFEVDDCEVTLFKDSRAIIKGTDEEPRAKVIYDKYIGS